MAKKLARLALTLAGAAAGAALVVAANTLLVSLGYLSIYEAMYTWGVALIYAASVILSAIIFYFISPKLIDGFTAAIRSAETKLSEMEVQDVLYSSIGLLIGLLIAFLGSALTSGIGIPILRFAVNALIYTVFGYLGWSVMRRQGAALGVPQWMAKRREGECTARPKVLDTSVIIDGRIADIAATGIMEGSIIVPSFVVQELQHIADNADALKRNRGRRGLDILREMMENGALPITVTDKDYEDVTEVDAKLLRLAAEMEGVVVTNDYNLNKVAALHNVPVFNINDLSNALKPIALPGEEMNVFIVKEGKEAGQGVAYLDDGTMIVVDGGRKYLNEMVDVSVTSVLQTSAGRMIFARIV